jgi:peptidoglycan hydrolase-like protein with peptidoglycan-binding domain
MHNLLFFKDGRQFLDVLLTVLRRKSVVDSEELVHSVLSTLNNLSYYPMSSDGAFGERQLEIAQGTL